MTSLWDYAIGAGIFVCFVALVATTVEAVREVLEVERDRRARVGGDGQSKGAPDPAAAVTAAPIPAVGYVDDEIARTARRVIRDVAGP